MPLDEYLSVLWIWFAMIWSYVRDEQQSLNPSWFWLIYGNTNDETWISGVCDHPNLLSSLYACVPTRIERKKEI